MFRFNIKHFLLALIIFFIEVLIAIYVHDDFVRPFVGDVLIVILLYCLLRAFTTFKVVTSAIAVLLFSYVVEILQYFDFVHLVGLGENKIARIVIGTSFSWWDLVCYTVGILIVLLTERIFGQRMSSLS